MGIVNEGLTYAMTTAFSTSPNKWYMGLISNSVTPVLQSTDTLAQVGGTNGWVEFNNYTGNRPLWVNGVPSNNRVTNATTTTNFTIAGTTGNTYTVYGTFLCSAATGTVGTLYSTRAFTAGTQVVTGTYVLQVNTTEGGVSS